MALQTYEVRGTPEDRRRARRVPTRRRALFCPDIPGAKLGEGIVSDISGLGIQLRTHMPPPLRARIQVELYPTVMAGVGQPMLLSGRVARVVPIRDSEHLVGVALRVPYNGRAALPARTPALATPANGVSAMDSPTRDGQFGRSAKWLAAGLCTLLLLLLLGGIDLAPGRLANTAAAAGTRESQSGPLPENLTETYPLQLGEESDAEANTANRAEPLKTIGDLEGLAMIPGEPLPALLRRGQTALVAGDLARARAIFDHVERNSVTASQRRAASLGRAQALAALGETGPALAAVDAMIRSVTARDAPELAAAARLEAVLLAEGGESAADPWAEPELAPLTRSSDPVLYMDVDRSAHSLTLYRDGRKVKSYPVGLGANHSTPLGRFTIANRIAKPDWYNDGESVPYGDPRNPLGESWMGLGKGGSATSYGIHPTNEPGSIGKSTGEGCIRMKPGDAAELFKLCPSGTPVHIRP